jgi:antitoxin (DNA-binding transcriptional repressor) of toxin-antitoxin stability system
MKTVTMLELRQHADRIVAQVQGGQRFVLTYRGKPVMRLEPIYADRVAEDDPIYGLASLADTEAEGMSNDDIDEAIYGK